MGLDLSAARKKITRAWKHHDALQPELDRVKDEPGFEPFTLGIEMDKKADWILLTAHNNGLPEHQLDVIFGDFIHNLRGALDHTIAALCDLCNVQIETAHQFPVQVRGQAQYLNTFGDPSIGETGKGRLKGITRCLSVIRDHQPCFESKKDPELHPLALIQRFSNADKHRELTVGMVLPTRVEIDLDGDPHEPVVIEDERIFRTRQPDAHIFEPNVDIDVFRLRLAQPLPRTITATPKVVWEVMFIASAFGLDKKPLAHQMYRMNELPTYVAAMLDEIEADAAQQP
jgi:hypothetical protein